MKAVVLTGIEKIELCEEPQPRIEGRGDVLVKVEQVGICGSDVHYYKTGRIGSQVVRYPYKVGHECSGTVAAAGSGVRQVRVGDRVAVDPAMPCHQCDQCRLGRENTCRNLKFLGTPGQAQGCLCEYIVMPQESLFAIPEQVSLAEAVICEPLSVAIYAVRQAGMPAAANAAILGSGPVGLCVAMAARAQRAGSIYMTDRVAERVKIAGKTGASWAGNPDQQDIVKEILRLCPLGLDCVYECAGQQETLDQAVQLLRPGGKLLIIGIPGTERVTFLIDTIRRKEITIVNIRRQNKCVQRAIELIASGQAQVNFMMTHRFGPQQSKEAFELVAGYRDGVVKALIEL